MRRRTQKAIAIGVVGGILLLYLAKEPLARVLISMQPDDIFFTVPPKYGGSDITVISFGDRHDTMTSFPFVDAENVRRVAWTDQFLIGEVKWKSGFGYCLYDERSQALTRHANLEEVARKMGVAVDDLPKLCTLEEARDRREEETGIDFDDDYFTEHLLGKTTP